jgi:hypothetical protein
VTSGPVEKAASLELLPGELVRSPVARRSAVLSPAPDPPKIWSGQCGRDAEPTAIGVRDPTQ